MVEYDKVNVNLSESGVALRMRMKQFNGNELPNEILLTAAQKN